MDLRTIKTRKLIKDTFIQMLSDTALNRITVTSLADRAMINRKTFYLHYETIESLISEFLNEIADDYIRYVDELPENRPHEDANRLFFNYFAGREDYVQRIICKPEYRELCNVIFDKAYTHSLNKNGGKYLKFSAEKQNIIQVFYRSSTLDIYRQWIKDGKKMPLEDVIELSNQLICHGVTDI